MKPLLGMTVVINRVFCIKSHANTDTICTIKEVKTMVGFNFMNLILFPFFMLIPLAVMYFIIKLAVKNAVREVVEEKSLDRKIVE